MTGETFTTFVSTYGPFQHEPAARDFANRMIKKFESENAKGQYVECVPMSLIPDCFE